MSEFNYQIDVLCDSFEDAWLTGERPSIAEILSRSASSLRQALLENLIRLDIEYRRKLGESISAVEYQEIGPEAVGIAARELDVNHDCNMQSGINVQSADDFE